MLAGIVISDRVCACLIFYNSTVSQQIFVTLAAVFIIFIEVYIYIHIQVSVIII